jgi:hypothetical protein
LRGILGSSENNCIIVVFGITKIVPEIFCLSSAETVVPPPK